MYRDPTRKRLKPQDTKFWRNANKLKRSDYKTLPHALAWEYPDTYNFLIESLTKKVPLERITILLWRDYKQQMQNFRRNGFGSFTPTSLRNFREKYFKTNNLPNPQADRARKVKEREVLILQCLELDTKVESLEPIEKRVCYTQIGSKLREKRNKILYRIADIETQIFHSKRVLEKSVHY